MKKLSLLLIFVLVFGGNVNVFSHSAESCCVIIAKTRQVIFADNANVRRGMASTTKIMTAIVAIENGNLDDEITVSQNAANQEGSSVYLKAGEKVTLRNLLYALMLNSGNDAAVAVAEGISGSCEEFAVLMNDCAEKLGCRSTHFENPSGLYSKNHFSTAYDMALIAAYAMENEAFAEIVSTKEYSFRVGNSVTYLKNHNKLLWQHDGCIGIKTGFTKNSGRCLVSCAKKDDNRIIVVTLSDRDDWRDHKDFFDSSFKRLKEKNVIQSDKMLCSRKINGEYIDLYSADGVTIPYAWTNMPRISVRLHIINGTNGKALPKGTKVGFAEVFVQKHKIADIDILCGENIAAEKKNGLLSSFSNLLKKLTFK